MNRTSKSLVRVQRVVDFSHNKKAEVIQSRCADGLHELIRSFCGDSDKSDVYETDTGIADALKERRSYANLKESLFKIIC